MSKVAIDFHRWMMENDTPENADKYFHWSDDDMFKEFLKHKNPTNSNDIPHSDIRRMESEGVYEEKFDKSNSSKDRTIYFQDEWNITPTSENPDPAGFGKDEPQTPKYFNTICYDEWDGEKPKDIQDWEETSFGKAHTKFTKDIQNFEFENDDESTYADGVDERPIKKETEYNDDEFDY
jgi:hypothetical protein